MADRAANGLVRLCRWAWVSRRNLNSSSDSYSRKLFDVVSGYKHKEIPTGSSMSVEELREKGYVMTEAGWMNVSIRTNGSDSVVYLRFVTAMPFP